MILQIKNRKQIFTFGSNDFSIRFKLYQFTAQNKWSSWQYVIHLWRISIQKANAYIVFNKEINSIKRSNAMAYLNLKKKTRYIRSYFQFIVRFPSDGFPINVNSSNISFTLNMHWSNATNGLDTHSQKQSQHHSTLLSKGLHHATMLKILQAGPIVRASTNSKLASCTEGPGFDYRPGYSSWAISQLDHMRC